MGAPMQLASMSWRERMARKPFAAWVILLGLLYFGVGLLGLVIPFILSSGTIDAIGIATLAFGAITILTGILTFKERPWTFALAALVGVLFLLLFGPFIGPTLTNPAEPTFWFAISGVPALILVVVFSGLMLLNAKADIASKPYLASPRSAGGLFTVAVVGFVVGGLIVGNIGAAAIHRVLQAEGPFDVRIVSNAAFADVPFLPATFNLSVGGTVIWYNGDTSIHTVKSNVSGQFDSGNLLPGATFRVTFNQAGTFEYHCEPHPSMTGMVVVA